MDSRTYKNPIPFFLSTSSGPNVSLKSVRLINEKNIPTGLLGERRNYEQDAALLKNQLEQFESFFGKKPLWFRTADEVFPQFLHNILWEVEVNALGSSYSWTGGDIPPVTEGEIISIPHHRKNRINFQTLNKTGEEPQIPTSRRCAIWRFGKNKKNSQ